MKLETKKLLFDTLGACREIAVFTEGMSFPDCQASSLLRSAVERQFEILGEAAVRLRDTHPQSLDAVASRFMSDTDFPAFFRAATGGLAPYDYQRLLIVPMGSEDRGEYVSLLAKISAGGDCHAR